jgi:hypothetical protein
VVLGFELRALHLLRSCFITWDTLPAISALVIFWIGSHIYVQASLDQDPPVYTYWVAWKTSSTTSFFLVYIRSCKHFTWAGFKP